MGDGTSGDLFDMTLEELTALKRWERGEPISANKLNESIEAINELRGIPPGFQVVPHVGTGGGAGGGTLAKLCQVVAADANSEALTVQFYTRNRETGELEEDGEPADVLVFPNWDGRDYEAFTEQEDFFLAFFIDGAWLVYWQMRLRPVRPDTNWIAGDCFESLF